MNKFVPGISESINLCNFREGNKTRFLSNFFGHRIEPIR
jgi:hypothetical protein